MTKARVQPSARPVQNPPGQPQPRYGALRTADTSRQDRELTRHDSGIYTMFLETKGAGYVKAMRSADKVQYMEHMSLGLETITYWGVSDYLSP